MADPNPPLTVRTFRQNGQGYFSTPVTIIAKIDGVQVFDGEVPTLIEPYPILPQLDVNIGVPMFTWEEPLSKNSGQMSMEITVTNGILLVSDTYSNASSAIPPSPTPDEVPYIDEYDFEVLTWWQYINQVWHSDALTEVTIDGIPQTRPTTSHPSGVNMGQWYWRVEAGSVFTANINLQIPPVPQPVGAPT
jgi:hypothetical protein